MWPFRRRPVVDDETAGWHAENFDWLERCFGSVAESELILPTGEFFDTRREDGAVDVAALFDEIKGHCGMADWPITLVPDDDGQTSARDGSPIPVVRERGVLGTASADEASFTITYQKTLVDEPVRLIATLAHELAHCLLATAEIERVCEPDEEEFLTDLTAVYLGFGVFLANSRFAKEVVAMDMGQGVGWSAAGYLPERDLIFALALFMARSGADAAAADEFLKSHLASLLGQALSDLSPGGRHERFAARS